MPVDEKHLSRPLDFELEKGLESPEKEPTSPEVPTFPDGGKEAWTVRNTLYLARKTSYFLYFA